MITTRTRPACLLLLILSLAVSAFAAAGETNITRATLKNGLRVIIVRNTLAPVVTVQENYLVGANETPEGFPGMAHAQEHMAFRGCQGVDADQTAAIYAQLGGDDNADTQQDITQYFATVAAQNLDIVLHMDAACMRGVDNSDQQWSQERGAIEQEVARDLSNPTYKFLTRLNQDIFAGTPYAHDALGSKPSFDATTGAKLQKFYRDWYVPNNAILVISGDVDPAATLAQVRALYESIPSRALPPRPGIKLQPVKAETFTLASDYPYTLAIVSYRMPGTDSKDFAAARVLSDVLGSQRGDIYALVPQGKALDAGFEMAEQYRQASVGFAYAVLPANADAQPIIAELQRLVANYAGKGVPADLVAASRRAVLASNEFARNSIPGLADLWSEAVASEGRNSPQDDVDAVQSVNIADVNRTAQTYLRNDQAIVATLKPQPSGAPAAAKGFGGTEKLTSAPTKPVPLPVWAKSLLNPLQPPKWDLTPTDTTLSNGIRLIVQPEKLSSTVTIVGEIRTQADLEVPAGREGVQDVLAGLFSYGTTTLDRLAFQKALDDIAAEESAGPSFSVAVLKRYFDRGVQLLADNELHPALPEPAFKVVKAQTADSVGGLLKSPGYLAERALEFGLLPKNDPALRQPTPKTVDGLTAADVHDYYARAYRPDLTTIVVIGDVTPDEAKTEIEKWFGSWKADGPKPQVDLPPVPPNTASATNVPDPSRIQDLVELSQELPMNRFDRDYYALELGNHVLGGGFYATRLYRDLREKTGLVYTVSNRLDAGRTRAVFTVSYACDPKNVSKARALVERDLRDMQNSPPTAGELQQAKALILRQIPLAESSEMSIAGGLLGRAVMGLPLDEPVDAAARYSALTGEQVEAAFAKWIKPQDFVQVVRGPKPQ
ncbi:MAG TPA: pitrilysin family protein [Terriglobales bacterium]|nr:pitrilysin family protein [Terriglobales bacterium]